MDPKITLRELGHAWGWSEQQLYRLVSRPDPALRIPHVRIGGRIYFEGQELERWLEARRSRPQFPALPKPRFGEMSHEQECRELGIPVDHEFA